jgi:DNA-binding response OmpR family regulator
VLNHSQLESMVYGHQAADGRHAIDSHVEVLRRKMGPAAGFIQSVAGSGYVFCGPLAMTPPI